MDAPGIPASTDDPRFVRSREQLHAAALTLARDTAAADITGAALARAAGLHRSTVYQHGADPAAIVRQALRAELDEIRAAVIDPATPDTIVAAIATSAEQVFAHIERHGPIYARELAAGTAGLGAMLAGHFAASIDLLIAHDALTPPRVTGDDDARFAATVAAALAASTVAVVTVWLADSEPRDRALLTRRWRAVLPPWWPVG
ncbi:TetR family transcriptional regulator [Microcella putealis]|uniref:TetR family transcriptional regulator n=1 Tax=Microcella putealis TaxID=337005 RepID=A0A4Q7LVK9_9MICO|nr:TetR family transcriptional regulator [Microcella putealis]RZS57719.1 TetR family transcriptional regulator [Microcella putealis]TQM24786.1 TetR family transcriptional regulator [Microcella putealis]